MSYDAKHEILISASSTRIYTLLEDYEAYPTYLDDFCAVRVDQVVNRRAFVTLQQRMLRTPVSYTIALDHKAPHRIQWSLSHSEQLDVHSGRWDIQEKDLNTCLLTVRCIVQLSQWIPEVMFSRSQDDFWTRLLQALKHYAETPQTQQNSGRKNL